MVAGGEGIADRPKRRPRPPTVLVNCYDSCTIPTAGEAVKGGGRDPRGAPAGASRDAGRRLGGEGNGPMGPRTEGGTARHDGDLLHPIGEAARLTGVSPGLLRLWERDRLINPRRSPGGHRLYSGDDLRRLRQIARLRRLERLNAAAIRRELGSATPHPAHPPAAEPDLGARLRALRTRQGASLADVAARTGLSVSFLSAVERGQANPSVGNLFKLADAYGTTVPGLGQSPRTDGQPLLRPAERPRYVADRGLVVIEDLIARPGALEAQRIEIGPGGGSEDAYAHPDEELIYVLTGRLAFWLGDGEHHHLAAGDSLSFRSTTPHRWRNDGDEPATVIWVNVPVVEPSAADDHARVAVHPRPANPSPTEPPP